jgi:hypothetical protein
MKIIQDDFYIEPRWGSIYCFCILPRISCGAIHIKPIFTKESLPMLLFWIVAVIVAVLSFKYSFSVIPVLGLLSCFYLMAQESYTNWLRFLIWLLIGLSIYFLYGRRHSRIGKMSENELQ